MSEKPRALLILIGMMGSGKSTIGHLLARRLSAQFIDCDRLLEERSGVSIATIFELEGEAGFRKREAALIDELTQQDNLVLATGGGAVMLEENRAHMQQRGLVIYLDASQDELLRRLKNDRSRPLLQSENKVQRIIDLLTLRAPLYKQCAHLSFSSSASSPKQLVQRILSTPRVIALFPATPANP